MNILLILLLCFLATAKVSMQSAFGKRHVKSFSDTLLFIGLIFVFSAALFLPYMVTASAEAVLYGAVFGLLTVVFQLAYTKALATGRVSLTVMFCNFSMVTPVLFSYFMYGERLSHFGICGMLLTAISFVVGADLKGTAGEKEKPKKAWLWFLALTFAANGGLMVTQKVFASSGGTDGQAFVAVSYVTAAAVTLSIYAVCRIKRMERSYRMRPRLLLHIALIGAVLGIFQAVNTYAVATVPAGILFPSYSGGCIVLSALAGVFFFHDRLQAKQILSIAAGTVAIVLMNI